MALYRSCVNACVRPCRCWTNVCRAPVRNSLLGVLGVLLLLNAAGCKEKDTIRRYQVAKPQLVEKQNPGKPRSQTASTSVMVPARILLAMITHGKDAWFFKLQAPVDQIQPEEDRFNQLVQSVRFEEGKPVWDLPEGWTQRPVAGEMRYATLLNQASPPLELAISSLPILSEDRNEYLLTNVNRWRNQLLLPPIDASGLGAVTRELATTAEGTEPAIIVDLLGRMPDGLIPAMSRLPESGMPKPSAGATSQVVASPPQLRYEQPEGWLPGRVDGQFRKAAFNVEQDGQKAEVTVIDLAGDSGSLAANLNRWRGQIGLEAISEEEIDTLHSPIEADGITGKLFYLPGPEDAAKRQSILIAIIPEADRTWFIKLQGDAALVEAEQERFAAFTRSIKFSASDEAEHGN